MRVVQSAVVSEGAPGLFCEDAVALLETPCLAIVADGMGGAGSGNIASSMAVLALRKNATDLEKLVRACDGDAGSRARLAVGRLLERAISEVNGEIAEQARRSDKIGMGTTVAALLVAGSHAHVASVGAVRVYLLREDRLRLLTEDHTVGMARVKQGLMTVGEYADSPLRKRLYQALGTSADVDVDLMSVELADRDLLVICTDGVHGVLDDGTIAECLGGSVEEAARSLIIAARASGSVEDASVAVLRLASDVAPQRVDAIAQVLSGTVLFHDLTNAERLLVAPYLDGRRLDPGAILFNEGDAGDAFYVVVDGAVRITRGGTPLTEVGPGGSFGHLCLARETPRSATVTALQPTLVLGLTRERFQEVVARRPTIGTKLLAAAMELIGERLRDITDRLTRVEKLAIGEEKPGELALRTAIVLAARGEES